jgi:hypothetical protein
MKIMLMVLVFVTGLIGGEIGIVVSAEKSAAMQQLATILHRLKHYPSPQGKAELKQILKNDSTGANEKTLASAILNLEHSAMVADIPKLKSVMADSKATPDEQTMAGIILNLDHRPSEEDKQKLSQMMQ